MDHSEFESKSILRHGPWYNYSQANVTNNRTKVKILCPEHGAFLQAPDHHMRGRGCPKCSVKKATLKDMNPEGFFTLAAELHKGFYDYSNSTFVSGSEKISILCPIHGEFSTLARKHLQEKRGCPSCGRVKTRYSQSVMYQDFFDSSVERHGYAYSYADVSLRFLSDDIDVVCPKHGAFTVVASEHIHGRGCPKCRPQGSSPENELADFVHSLGHDIVRNTRKLIPPLELDIVVPDLKIAFEFNGIFWHSEQAGKSVEYHQNKTLMTQRAGFRLFHVYESDWDLNKEFVASKIKAILSKPTCPDLSSAYALEEYSGSYSLILKGSVIASFRSKNQVAIDSWSPFGLVPLKLLMHMCGVKFIKTSLDWPEFSLGEFTAMNFEKYQNVRPERLYFDKKTLRRLKEKPEQRPGLDFLSVVDSGSTIWQIAENVTCVDVVQNHGHGA